MLKTLQIYDGVEKLFRLAYHFGTPDTIETWSVERLKKLSNTPTAKQKRPPDWEAFVKSYSRALQSANIVEHHECHQGEEQHDSHLLEAELEALREFSTHHSLNENDDQVTAI